MFIVARKWDFIVVVVVDDNTTKRKTMDVARVLIRTRIHDVINCIRLVENNGELFEIKIVEDWHGPLQLTKPISVKINFGTDDSFDSGGDDSATEGEDIGSVGSLSEADDLKLLILALGLKNNNATTQGTCVSADSKEISKRTRVV